MVSWKRSHLIERFYNVWWVLELKVEQFVHSSLRILFITVRFQSFFQFDLIFLTCCISWSVSFFVLFGLFVCFSNWPQILPVITCMHVACLQWGFICLHRHGPPPPHFQNHPTSAIICSSTHHRLCWDCRLLCANLTSLSLKTKLSHPAVKIESGTVGKNDGEQRRWRGSAESRGGGNDFRNLSCVHKMMIQKRNRVQMGSS